MPSRLFRTYHEAASDHPHAHAFHQCQLCVALENVDRFLGHHHCRVVIHSQAPHPFHAAGGCQSRTWPKVGGVAATKFAGLHIFGLETPAHSFPVIAVRLQVVLVISISVTCASCSGHCVAPNGQINDSGTFCFLQHRSQG